MKNIFGIFFLFAAGLISAQTVPTKTYDNEHYSISYPEGWKLTNDSDIINIFPGNEIGAVTISEYHDLNLPKTETKKFIIDLYKSGDDESKVKSRGSKKGYTEYVYEYADEKNKLFWVTKVFQKGKDLYLVSVNCEQKYWNGNYNKLFSESLNSFSVKK